MSNPLEKPSFALNFPKSEALDVILDAFAGGDYRRVRKLGASLADSTDDPQIRAAANEVVLRTNADPAVLKLLGLSVALLVFLSSWWIVNAKPPVGAEPRAPASQGMQKR